MMDGSQVGSRRGEGLCLPDERLGLFLPVAVRSARKDGGHAVGQITGVLAGEKEDSDDGSDVRVIGEKYPPNGRNLRAQGGTGGYSHRLRSITPKKQFPDFVLTDELEFGDEGVHSSSASAEKLKWGTKRRRGDDPQDHHPTLVIASDHAESARASLGGGRRVKQRWRDLIRTSKAGYRSRWGESKKGRGERRRISARAWQVLYDPSRKHEFSGEREPAGRIPSGGNSLRNGMSTAMFRFDVNCEGATACERNMQVSKGNMVMFMDKQRNLMIHSEVPAGPVTPMKPQARKRKLLDGPTHDLLHQYATPIGQNCSCHTSEGASGAVLHNSSQRSSYPLVHEYNQPRLRGQLFVELRGQEPTASWDQASSAASLYARETGVTHVGGDPSRSVVSHGPHTHNPVTNATNFGAHNLRPDLMSETPFQVLAQTNSIITDSFTNGATHTLQGEFAPPAIFLAQQQTPPPVYTTLPSSTNFYTMAAGYSYHINENGAESVCPSSGDCHQAPATPNKGTWPKRMRSRLPTLAPNLHSVSVGHASSPAANGEGDGQLEVRQDDHGDMPDTVNLLLPDEPEKEFFDLNELPPQSRKNSKARKKHRPKVFREDRPQRGGRKQKKAEEPAANPNCTAEGPQVTVPAKGKGKGKGRRKRSSAEVHSATELGCQKQVEQNTPVNEGWNGAATHAESVGCQNEATDFTAAGQLPANSALLPLGVRNDFVDFLPISSGCLPPAGIVPMSDLRSERSSERVPNDALHFAETLMRPPVMDFFPGLSNVSTLLQTSGERSCELEGLSEALEKEQRQEPENHAHGKDLCISASGESDANLAGELCVGANGQNFITTGEENSGNGDSRQGFANVALVVAAVGVRTKRKYTRKTFPPVLPVGSPTQSEVVTNDGLTPVGKEIVTPSTNSRMRAAARLKSRDSNHEDNTKNPQNSFDASVPTLLVETDIASVLDGITEKLSGLEIVPHAIQNSAIVPYEGTFLHLRRRKPRPKVMLDLEDKRVWRLIMDNGTECQEKDSEGDPSKQWDKERTLMKSRAEKFISIMHLVQGDRRFSVWKGSVIDSIVGAFLTQNVSDHLSSSAFMALASRFPVARSSVPAKIIRETVPEVHVEECSVSEIQVPGGFETVEKSSQSPCTQTDVAEETIYTPVSESESNVLAEEALGFCEKSSVATESLSSFNELEGDFTVIVPKNHTCTQESTNVMASRSPEEDFATTSMEYVHAWSAVDETEPHSSPSKRPSCGTSNRCLIDVNKSYESVDMNVISANCDESYLRMLGGSEEVGNYSILGATDSNHTLYQSELQEMIDFPDQTQMIDGPTVFSKLYEQEVSERTTAGCDCLVDKGEILEPFPLEQTCGTLVVDLSPTADELSDDQSSAGGQKSCVTSDLECAANQEAGTNTSTVIYSSDSFSTQKHSQQLTRSATETLDGLGSEFSGGLHGLKTIMRNKVGMIKRALQPNLSSKSGSRKMTYSSELVNSTSGDVEEGMPGSKKLSFIGITGLARAKLEQANVTSKVAVDWESIRLKHAVPKTNEGQSDSSATPPELKPLPVENGVDWEAVKLANLEDVADVIKERGMNNVLAGRIKAFLERVHTEHGSLNIEWLRTVPVEDAKAFLLSVRGLGLKSVECIRLLTLHHLAFPVDTNVGRICVRLGWVPLEPLPEELQLHLLELYPVQETIQKYLWPRLCTLDQRTLYELHYQMITFGKVFCTKSRPNCNACPMRGDCQHFASALASARMALPAAPHEDSNSATNSERLALPAAAANFLKQAKGALPLPLLESGLGEDGLPSYTPTLLSSQKSCEPIIEEPSTPEHVVPEFSENDIEQLPGDVELDTYIGVSSQSSGLYTDNSTEIEIVLPTEAAQVDAGSKAMVLLPPEVASIPVPQLKNVGRLRTVHYVYELPDNHPLIHEMDDREPDDPCVYLLAIWSPGETPESTPVLDDLQGNGPCDGFDNNEAETVKGTLLVPCRTAMRGIFPLNGTYFQVNEVFADHASSLQPIEVPRRLLWNLRRRFVYFGTSVTTIFKGLSVDEIQACFWRGYVCVRGFDSKTRAPRPLAARLHFPASKVVRKQKGDKGAANSKGLQI